MVALMNANNDPLGVRSASVSGSDAEGRPFEVRWSARPTFFIWPHLIVGTISSDCREEYPISVDKMAWRCKRVTERANSEPSGANLAGSNLAHDILSSDADLERVSDRRQQRGWYRPAYRYVKVRTYDNSVY